MFIYLKLIFFFSCELLEWAVQQLHLVIVSASWTEREEILLETETLYLFSMGTSSLGELDVEKGCLKAPRESLKCCYKSLYKKSIMYNTSGFIDQKYKFQVS